MLIVDDESPARTRLRHCLEEASDVEIVGSARDGREALRLIRGLVPDLVFLDVKMPDIDGFDVLEQLGTMKPVTIFVTAFDSHAIRAFEAQALDYLLKPFSHERFEAALQRARQAIHARRMAPPAPPAAEAPKYLERIMLKSDGGTLFLSVDDIKWIEAAGVYVELHVGTKTYLYRSSMIQMAERLDPHRFVRIHRSTLVNTASIQKVQPRSHGDYTVVLDDGTELVMGRAHRENLDVWLRQPL